MSDAEHNVRGSKQIDDWPITGQFRSRENKPNNHVEGHFCETVRMFIDGAEDGEPNASIAACLAV